MLPRSEVKKRLQITSNDYDTLIDSLIIPCTNEVCSYTNSHYLVPKLTFTGEVTFENISNESFIILPEEFISQIPQSGYLSVLLSILNSGVFEYSKTTAPNKVKVIPNLIAGVDSCLIGVSYFNEEIKNSFVYLIGWYLWQKGIFEKNESLPDGYSVNYNSKNELMYNLFGRHRVI